ncbi:MAG TPA: cyclic nucleotide-binding domain-containing protein, partial [Pirellula sp.]|nr:cyclic nucleotide-binding domain-containing protein [Pirellula sp.]
RRLVFRLNGVLFFGNCETLAQELGATFKTANFVVLDCRNVTDIDASGANILREVIDKSRKVGRRLLFCNVPTAFRNSIERIAGPKTDTAIFMDLDSALEWVEDTVLGEHPNALPKPEPLSLEQHDLVRNLAKLERETLTTLLTRREFSKGETLAIEGEPGDRMWLIVKGSVDVLLQNVEHHVKRRIASLAAGTTVGEMALVENSNRSATIVAAEDVICWELDRNSYHVIMKSYPEIGTRLLTNLIAEMAHRIRITSDQLREMES